MGAVTCSFYHEHAAFFSLISVYATLAKFSLVETSILLFIATIAGVIGQGPIGYFSDTFDRRKVIVITTFGSCFLAFISILTSNDPIQNIYYMDEFGFRKIIFFIAVGLYSSLCLPLFSLDLAHTNDFVPKSKFVAAGGGLQFIFGVGAISGPILCSIFMEWFGNTVSLLPFLLKTSLFSSPFLERSKSEDDQ